MSAVVSWWFRLCLFARFFLFKPTLEQTFVWPSFVSQFESPEFLLWHFLPCARNGSCSPCTRDTKTLDRRGSDVLFPFPSRILHLVVHNFYMELFNNSRHTNTPPLRVCRSPNRQICSVSVWSGILSPKWQWNKLNFLRRSAEDKEPMGISRRRRVWRKLTLFCRRKIILFIVTHF